MEDEKICILGPKIRNKQEIWLLEEAKRIFDRVAYIEIPLVRIYNNDVFFKNTNLADYDCIIPRIPRTYRNFGYIITKLLEHKVISPIKPESILVAHNKFLTHLALDEVGIPVPKTFTAQTRVGLEKIFDTVQYPIVIKVPYGSLGKGVMFAESKETALPIIDTIEGMNQTALVQEFVGKPGEDIRAVVIGNRVVAAMRRISGKGERRANIGSGGKGKKIKLSSMLEDLAIRTAKTLGLEIAGIDIIETDDGPMVIEANVNVVFEEATAITKTNIARLMVEHMKEKLKSSEKTNVAARFHKLIEDLRWKPKTPLN